MDADGETVNSSSSVIFFFHRKAQDMHSLDMNLCKNVKEGAVKEMQNGLTACQKYFTIHIVRPLQTRIGSC